MMTNVDLTTIGGNRSTLYTTLGLPQGSRSIRVLDIHGPSPLEDGGPLQCDVRIIDLDPGHGSSFTALSYVWDIAVTGSYSITCNSFPITVTPNCHSALRHLRNKLGKFTIWIDAICINQDDEREKESQIQIMGDIYSTAETVFIWLGDGDAATNRAMTYLQSSGYRQYFFDISTEQASPRPDISGATWCGLSSLFGVTGPLYPSRSHSMLP
jgi:hypothetical protein